MYEQQVHLRPPSPSLAEQLDALAIFWPLTVTRTRALKSLTLTLNANTNVNF